MHLKWRAGGEHLLAAGAGWDDVRAVPGPLGEADRLVHGARNVGAMVVVVGVEEIAGGVSHRVSAKPPNADQTNPVGHVDDVGVSSRPSATRHGSRSSA